MSRILMVWEMGGGLGHYSTLKPIADELRTRGHDIYFAVQDLSRSEYILGGDEYHILQAPIWLRVSSRVGMQPTNSYADLLMNFGYLDPAGLTGVVKAWRNLIRLVKPDLVIVNHSPTVLLAMHGSAMHVVSIGHGFLLPPNRSPLPPFSWWDKVDTAKLKNSEDRVLAVVNTVLNKFGVEPMKHLSDLFYSNENFLCTFEELDHYKSYRDDVTYLGPLFTADHGVTPEWPVDSKKKIFVYLTANYQNIDNLLVNLSKLPYHYLVYIPGFGFDQAIKFKSKSFTFLNDPAQINLAAKYADAAVTHGGIGTTMQFMLAGVPLLLVPRQMEQYLFCKRLAEFGSAVMVEPHVENVHHDVFLKKLVEDNRYHRKAVEFSERYADFSVDTLVRRIASRCEAIIENEAVPA